MKTLKFRPHHEANENGPTFIVESEEYKIKCMYNVEEAQKAWTLFCNIEEDVGLNSINRDELADIYHAYKN